MKTNTMRFIKFSMIFLIAFCTTMGYSQTSEQQLRDLINKIQNNIPVAGQKVNLRNINFGTGSWDLGNQEKQYLDVVAEFLNQIPTVEFEVEGHTDDVGDAEYNRTLSSNRAAAVKNYLISRGAYATNISARGFGEDQPLYSGQDESSRALNRRVEMRVKSLGTQQYTINLKNGEAIVVEFFLIGDGIIEYRIRRNDPSLTIPSYEVSSIKGLTGTYQRTFNETPPPPPPRPTVPKDTDGDGVSDAEDRCPNERGTINGCPDKDNDGYADSIDNCPNIYGKVEGCPDTDGDGFVDKQDDCPNQKGTLGGCPDSDSDGIANKDDNCPDKPGSLQNGGCPVEKEPSIITEIGSILGVTPISQRSYDDTEIKVNYLGYYFDKELSKDTYATGFMIGGYAEFLNTFTAEASANFGGRLTEWRLGGGLVKNFGKSKVATKVNLIRGLGYVDIGKINNVYNFTVDSYRAVNGSDVSVTLREVFNAIEPEIAVSLPVAKRAKLRIGAGYKLANPIRKELVFFMQTGYDYDEDVGEYDTAVEGIDNSYTSILIGDERLTKDGKFMGFSGLTAHVVLTWGIRDEQK